MQIEFDPDKDAANVAKHGLSLARAIDLEGIMSSPIRDMPRNVIGCTAQSTACRIARRRRYAAIASASSICAARTARSFAAMSDSHPVVFDEENPEWTEKDFAHARPIGDFPELAAAFPKARGPQRTPTKEQVTIRLDRDVLAKFRATGRGWQSRINAALKAARL